MYPTSPLHFPKREIIYLSVYWFEDGKKKKEKKNKHRGKKAGFRQEYIKWHWVCFMVLFFKLL